MNNQPQNRTIFPISPLISITLLSLYFALTIPLPFLVEKVPINLPEWLMWLALFLGALLLWIVLSERVMLKDEGIYVTYPNWVKIFWRRGWHLKWEEIDNLKLRTTSQGGLVYYFTTKEKDRAYLLPMRVVGFAQMVRQIEEKTGIDTNDIRPLAQPWMYIILFIFTLFLLLIDLWIIFNANV